MAISQVALLRFLRKMRINEKIKYDLNGGILMWYNDTESNIFNNKNLDQQ
jgi:hypothetical protein